MTYIIYLKLTDADAQLNNINIHLSKYQVSVGYISRENVFSHTLITQNHFGYLQCPRKRNWTQAFLEVNARSLVKQCEQVSKINSRGAAHLAVIRRAACSNWKLISFSDYCKFLYSKKLFIDFRRPWNRQDIGKVGLKTNSKFL